MSDVQAVRIGIDVGGTFTHAVAIDHRTLEILDTVCVPTTHQATEGVAKGIAQCLEELVAEARVRPEAVVFVAHSTTQATNALLEGDVARVGLIGLARGVSGAKARKELDFPNVPLAGAHVVAVDTIFVDPEASGEELLSQAKKMQTNGVAAFVVAQAFAVDDPTSEQRVLDAIEPIGVPATATHQVSGLYGLRARTRTSIINAGILPRMVEVSQSTRRCVENLGIGAALMIMRSDGGVMDASRMAHTPILTILSGPAAGVSAAILYEKLSHGLFVEVGGTSTDVSLILNGRPQRKNAMVGGNILYLETLDVRTVGVAGGSMARVKNGKIMDVGPRSAHIAGLQYACFSEPEKVAASRAQMGAPKSGDPDDYAMLVLENGERLAVTTTCAANALGIVPDGDYAAANRNAARTALSKLADLLGSTAERVAREIIDLAAGKIASLCTQLITDYECRNVTLELLGGGGGAAVIAAPTAEKLKLTFKMSRNAPVISAVGAGMAMMKEVVEKSIINPTEDDIRLIRSEAVKILTGAGCDPNTIEVEVSVDARKGVVRASATGTSALVADKQQERISETAARAPAAARLNTQATALQLEFSDADTYVFQAEARSGGLFGIGKKKSRPAAVVDARGLVRLTVADARIYSFARADAVTTVSRVIKDNTIYGDGGAILAPTHLVYGGKVIDLSHAGGPDAAQRLALMEIDESAAYNDFCLITES